MEPWFQQRSSLILKFLTMVLYCFSVFVVLVTKRLQQIIRRGHVSIRNRSLLTLAQRKREGHLKVPRKLLGV